jgi:hypothetical protein
MLYELLVRNLREEMVIGRAPRGDLAELAAGAAAARETPPTPADIAPDSS